MANVRISELNQLSIVSVDDFIPVVDSGSLTTYRTPMQSLLNTVAISGSVPSASWASSSISSSYAKTASFAWDYSRVKSVTKWLYNTASYSQDMAKIYNDPTGTVQDFQNLLVSMKCWGDITSVAKTYLITCDSYSPGIAIDPYNGTVPLDTIPWAGYYSVKPLSATRNYAPTLYNTDYELEMSQSFLYPSGNQLFFRIRCVAPPTSSLNQKAAGILTFWVLNQGNGPLGPFDFKVDALPDNKTLSSNDLPVWNTAFVEIKNYKMTVSGSLTVEKGITGSLFGTSSWALKVPGIDYVVDGGSYNISASWASASLSSSVAISASYAKTSSFAVSSSYSVTSSFSRNSNTASYVDIASLASALPGLPKAWATCACTASNPSSNLYITIPGKNWNNYAILSGYNVTSVIRALDNGGNGVPPKSNYPGLYYGSLETFTGAGSSRHWIVTLSNPLPTLNYTVIGGVGGEPGTESSYFTMYPYSARTTTAFTLSMASDAGGMDWTPTTERNWFSFMVFSNP